MPYEITEAMIQCFGKCFHYKDLVASFFSSSGVSDALVNKYRGEAKYVWVRRVLAELSNSPEGTVIQQKILTNLCMLRGLPDANAPDRNSALDALRKLKELALEHDLIAREERQTAMDKKSLAEQRQNLIKNRAHRLEALKKQFMDGFSDPNRQKAGYLLEDLLRELFDIFEIEYRKPYRTETQQVDGFFRLDSFPYIIEAKWRKDKPNEQEIGGFRQKVENKLESTRGLFISIPGFRDEVITQFSGRGANIIFMTGEDIIHILEGRHHLQDALKAKIEKAEQEGRVYYPLSSL